MTDYPDFEDVYDFGIFEDPWLDEDEEKGSTYWNHFDPTEGMEDY